MGSVFRKAEPQAKAELAALNSKPASPQNDRRKKVLSTITTAASRSRAAREGRKAGNLGGKGNLG